MSQTQPQAQAQDLPTEPAREGAATTKHRYHVWGSDGRSLCDQRAIPDLDRRAKGAARPSGRARASVCGACVIVAQELLYMAKCLIYEFGEPTPAPPMAIAELDQPGSRWPLLWDIKELRDKYREIGYRYPWFEQGQDVAHDVRGGQSGQSPRGGSE